MVMNIQVHYSLYNSKKNKFFYSNIYCSVNYNYLNIHFRQFPAISTNGKCEIANVCLFVLRVSYAARDLRLRPV